DREIARVALCTLRAGRARAPGSACAAGSAVGPRGSLCADELREIDGRLLLLARVANDHDARLLDAHGSIQAAPDERERGCSDGDETNGVHENPPAHMPATSGVAGGYLGVSSLGGGVTSQPCRSRSPKGFREMKTGCPRPRLG